VITLTVTGDGTAKSVTVQVQTDPESEFEEVVDADLGGGAETVQPDNPILPVLPEIIWGGACFLVLWALMKFWLLKPYTSTMQARADKVRADLEAADAASAQADAALADYEASLAGARAEASRLVDDARVQAEAHRREVLGVAEGEVAEAKAAAAAEVAEAKAAALAELRPSVTTIATQAAAAVVGRPLDPAQQQAIVEEYLERNASKN
jgi:F-type H+-transporting ATPase subunit b